jgi:hypothetical protein
MLGPSKLYAAMPASARVGGDELELISTTRRISVAHRKIRFWGVKFCNSIRLSLSRKESGRFSCTGKAS